MDIKPKDDGSGSFFLQGFGDDYTEEEDAAFRSQFPEYRPALRPALVRRIFRTWLFIMAFFFALMLLYEVMKG